MSESLTDELGLTRSEYQLVVPALFAYLFYKIDQRRFIEYINDPALSKRVLAASKSNGYVLKNCKLFAYHNYVSKITGAKPTDRAAFGVDSYDARLLRKFNLSHLGTTTYHAMTLREFDLCYTKLYDSPLLKAWKGKLISKKMTFLIKSYGWSRHDIESHLDEAALYALLKQYPRYTNFLHFTNVAKTTMHNAAMTMITTQTKAKRNRLTAAASDGTHQAVHAPIEELDYHAAPDNTEIRQQLTSLVALAPKMTVRVQDYLACMGGQYHEGLSLYMKRDNSEAASSMDYEAYRTKVESYFDVQRHKTEELFQRLRKHL